MEHDLLLQAYRIRRIELEIARRYSDERMRCPVHLSVGQEINAVKICQGLTKDDYMVSTHRGHAHYLAKGGSLNKLIAELHGWDTGCSRGHGGSMHLVDWSCGFAGSTSIVGGTIPIGVGLAFQSKLDGSNRKTAICIGDAAIEQGVFWESLNFANLHRLDVRFYIEDNETSCYTHISDRQHFNTMAKIKLSPRTYIMPAQRIAEHCGPKIEKLDDELSLFEPGPSDMNNIKEEINEAFKCAK